MASEFLLNFLNKSDCFQIKDRNELRTALQTALDAGYRCFDTAYNYANVKDMGDFFAEIFEQGNIKREDIFIITKLQFQCHKPGTNLLPQKLNLKTFSYKQH